MRKAAKNLTKKPAKKRMLLKIQSIPKVQKESSKSAVRALKKKSILAGKVKSTSAPEKNDIVTRLTVDPVAVRYQDPAHSHGHQKINLRNNSVAKSHHPKGV